MTFQQQTIFDVIISNETIKKSGKFTNTKNGPLAMVFRDMGFKDVEAGVSLIDVNKFRYKLDKEFAASDFRIVKNTKKEFKTTARIQK